MACLSRSLLGILSHMDGTLMDAPLTSFMTSVESSEVFLDDHWDCKMMQSCLTASGMPGQ